jgi:MFS transporter, DHA2 family, multidrug resistance protein
MTEEPSAADVNAASSSAEWRPRYNPWVITVAVMLPTFMEILDTSIVNVALPHIAGNLSAATDEATWVLTSYLVSNAIVLPASAWFGRVFGRKRFLMVCIAMFTLASALCGSSGSLATLILARVAQGTGGGALQPISHAILLESFPPGLQGTAMAAYGIGVVVAPIIGPTLGGWITDNYSWRWIFYINLPVGILAILLVHLFVEDPPYLHRDPKARIDYLGFGLMALALGTLQVVLDRGERDDWFAASWIGWATAVIAVSAVAFVVRELRVRDPIVNLRVFTNRNFAFGAMFIGVVGVVLYSTTAMLPLFLQTLVNYPALQSGLALSPRGIGSFLTMIVMGRIIMRVDARLLIATGFGLLTYSCVRFGGFTLDISLGHVILPSILNGMGMACIFVPLATTSMITLPREEMGNATGIFNLMRNIGGGVGIAITTTLLARSAQTHQTLLVGHMNPFDPVFQQWLAGGRAVAEGTGGTAGQNQVLALAYGLLVQQATLAAFIDVFHVLAIMCLVCLPGVLFLRRVRGAAALAAH